MSLFVASLNSGSNGNCYYVGDGESAVLIDVGISCREVERRMKRIGLSMSTVRAIFVTHEHSDHIKGVPVLSRKHNLPVYITEATLRKCRGIEEKLVAGFSAHTAVKIGALKVTGFPKWHDAVDPHSFIVTNQRVTVGVFTDLGMPCEHVKKYFKLCHAAFLESNYDEKMLETGGYPWRLKERVRGGKGHLSNVQAAELFLTEGSPNLTHLFLSHLSQNNNHPKIVRELFRKCAGDTQTFIASRDQETAVYKIEGMEQVDLSARRAIDVRTVKQLTLW